jgi:hypothetical protein
MYYKFFKAFLKYYNFEKEYNEFYNYEYFTFSMKILYEKEKGVFFSLEKTSEFINFMRHSIINMKKGLKIYYLRKIDEQIQKYRKLLNKNNIDLIFKSL